MAIYKYVRRVRKDRAKFSCDLLNSQQFKFVKRMSLKSLLIGVVILSLAACATTAPPPPADSRSKNEVLVDIFEQYGIEAVEIDLGVLIYLPKLSFEFNSTDLSPVVKNRLAYVVRVCNAPDAINRHIIISGHTDAVGTRKNNFKVSKIRAETVSATLENLGLAKERMQLKWFGAERPLLPNTLSDGEDHPKGRATNRRVEILILNPDQ